MLKSIDNLEIEINQLKEMIDSGSLCTYSDWKPFLFNYLLKLNKNQFSFLKKSIINNDFIKEFIENSFDIPDQLSANLTIKNSMLSVSLIDPPFSFLSCVITDDLNYYNSDLEINKEITVYKDRKSFGEFICEPDEIKNESHLNIDRTVAACIVAFSLQFPSALPAFSQTNDLINDSTKVLLKESYESLQSTKNKKFIPILRNIYKINELSSKKHYQLDHAVSDLEKDEMIDHVASLINSFYAKLNITKKDAKNIAKKIIEVSKEKDIDYRIFLSIIREESNFKQSAYNPSGDYSLAQINYNIWNEDFKRRKKKPINLNKLKKDSNYSIDLMGEILSYLKNNSKKDPLWYAKYHSKTPSKKISYAQKIKKHLDHLNRYEEEELQNAIIEYQVQISKFDKSDFYKEGIDDQKILDLNNELSSLIVNFNNSKIAYND